MFKRSALISALVILTLTAVSFAVTINVPADQPTIQAGIDAAIQGDTVLIADGTYSGAGNWEIVVSGKQVVIKGANGPDAAIIFCEDTVAELRYRGFNFLGAGASGSIVDGITITRALVDTGSAVYAEDASLTFVDCKFASSGLSDDYGYTPFAGGGGFFRRCEEVRFEDCRFEGCQADGGGGFFADSCVIVTVENCTFIDNFSAGTYAFLGQSGGAACVRDCDSVLFQDCLFKENSADGASYVTHIGTPGVASVGSNTRIHFCLFESNWSYVWDNSGTSIWAMDGTLDVAYCTFYDDESYGMFESGVIYARTPESLVRNCIFANNRVQDPVVVFYDYPGVLECSNVYGNTGGNWVGALAPFFQQDGNFSADPVFCDTANDDFTLGDVSPCLPSNNECGVQIGAYGQGCTGCFDIDEDSHCYAADNCPDVYNPGQEDSDGEGPGDACCCVCPTVGNIDGSDDCLVTMGDLTRIIDNLFISMTPLSCPADANVDGSVDGLVTMGDLTVLIDHLFISLQPLGPCGAVSATPSAALIGHSNCKGKDQQTGATTRSSTESCVDWSYSGATLNLTHRDAGFNCCPVILADITIDDFVITITEIDSLFEGGCWCECLFDVDYRITGLAPGEYRIVIESPYRPVGDEVLDITIDLITEPTGSHCVARSQYPWSDL